MGREFNGIILPPGVEVHYGQVRIVFMLYRIRRREVLGLKPTKTNIKFAARKLAAIKHEIHLGTFNYSSHFPDSKHANCTGKVNNSITVAQLAEKYINLKKNEIRASTIRKYQSTFAVTLNILGPSRLVSSLLPIDILNLRSELMVGRAANTTNTYITCVQSLLKFAEETGHTKKELSKKLTKVKGVNKEPDPLTFDEFQRALDACRHDQHRNIITLMAYTGLRNGELSGLAWEDIDLEARTLTVRRATDSRNMMKTPKTDLERVVDLHPPAIEALLSQKSLSFMRPSDKVAVELPDKTIRYDKVRYVFLPNVINANTNYPFMAKITMIRMWESVCKLAGIRYRPFYQLRHTFASWSLTAHGNVAYIAGQMGHKDYSMLIKVYGRWMPSESKKEHERIWNELESMGHKFKKMPRICPEDKKRC